MLKRLHYNRPQGEGFPPKKKYFGVCQAGPTAYPHQPQISYENEDAKKCSYPMTRWIIKAPKEIEVKAGVVDRSKPQPYLKLRDEPKEYPLKNAGAKETEQRFEISTVYRRGDGTPYKEKTGEMTERRTETACDYIGITRFSYTNNIERGKPCGEGYIRFLPDAGNKGWSQQSPLIRKAFGGGFIWPTYRVTQKITRQYSDAKKAPEWFTKFIYRAESPVTLQNTPNQPIFDRKEWEEADWKAQME